MKAPPPSGHGGLLMIRGGAMGDLVLTLPALRLMRQSFPAQRIEVLGTPGLVDLAVHFGLADAVRRLEDPGLARFFVPGSVLDPGWSAYFASFSVVVSYLSDPDDNFHQNLRRAGVSTLLRGPHRPVENGQHATEQLAAPLAGLALFFEPGEAGKPMDFASTGPREPVIAIHPGSGSPRKNWGLENWVHVTRQLHLQTGARFLVVAGEAEVPTLAAFRDLLTAHHVPHGLADQLPLPEVARQLARCQVFLGHDTGPAHLAAACGVPSVLVFGPTDPAVWGPVGGHVRILRAPSASLTDVSAADVTAAALSAWRAHAPVGTSANSSAG
jgi:heptosyltransferase-3